MKFTHSNYKVSLSAMIFLGQTTWGSWRLAAVGVEGLDLGCGGGWLKQHLSGTHHCTFLTSDSIAHIWLFFAWYFEVYLTLRGSSVDTCSFGVLRELAYWLLARVPLFWTFPSVCLSAKLWSSLGAKPLNRFQWNLVGRTNISGNRVLSNMGPRALATA